VTLEETTAQVQALFAKAEGFSDTLTFDFGNDGLISVDGTQSPPAVSNQDIGSDCTISISLDDFFNILDGSLDPQMACRLNGRSKKNTEKKAKTKTRSRRRNFARNAVILLPTGLRCKKDNSSAWAF